MTKNFSQLFNAFFDSEKAGGMLLVACTILSLVVANSFIGEQYLIFLHRKIDLSVGPIELSYTFEHWVNDGLMAIFFLLVGLEIERELYIGELASFQKALLPIIAALGGMIFPALIHYLLNAGTVEQSGFGIPMATDIAFALGVLALCGKVPTSLKVFLTALAIIDDLGAITVIALFYTKSFSASYFFLAMFLFALLFGAGKLKIHNLAFYLIGGVIMWYCMLKSGVHATIAGVLLAFAIPFHKDDEKNPSYKLQHYLHKPVAFVVLPIFALSNTAIVFPSQVIEKLKSRNSLGIITGLTIGKFLGIFLTSWFAVKIKVATLGSELTWRHIAGIALLGGIGFTMSVFIANLAFDLPEVIIASKLSVLCGSFCAAIAGFSVLKSRRMNHNTS